MELNKIIKDAFNRHKITQMQLDPNGHCNAGCWFCPVSYKGNPEHAKKPMPIFLLKKIINNLLEERDKEDGLVSKNFWGFYTSHYNETLLYPYLEDFFELLREKKLYTMILSNGTTLTPNKIDLIKNYDDVISGINLNIPIFTSAELWAKRTNMNEALFPKMLRNIEYAIEKLPHRVENKSFSVGINGINKNSLFHNGGWIETGINFPKDMDLNVENGENAQQLKKINQLFPNLQAYTVPHLIDRAGLMDGIIDNKKAINKYLMRENKNKKVIGCGNGIEVGGRPIGWIHINSIGDVFLCCNDYDMEVVIGNFQTQELKDFWGKEDHINKIAESYEGMCRVCASAKFEE